MGKDRENRSKRAIRLQRDILKSTSMLHSLGYRIETRYIKGAGWHSEIVDNNNGENHELDEHSEPETTPIDDYIQGGNNE